HRIVRTLKKTILAVLDKLEGLAFATLTSRSKDGSLWSDNRDADIIFGLQLCSRIEILAQTESAPSALGIVPDAKVVRTDVAIAIFQFMAQLAIDVIHRKSFAPII